MPKIEHAFFKKSETTPPQITKPLISKVIENVEPVKAAVATQPVVELPSPTLPDFDKIFQDPVLKIEADKKATLEKLILLRQPVKKDVTLGKLTYTFRLLNSNDSAEVYALAEKFPPEEQNKGSVLLLAASLTHVNGVPLETAYDGPADIKNEILQRYSEIARWPSPLTNSLTKEYRKFIDDEDKKYNTDFLEK